MAAPGCRSPRPPRSSRRSIARAATAPLAMRRCTSWAPSSGTARGAEAAVPAQDRDRRAAPAGLRRTEPTSGTDTTALRTIARREGDNYVVNGQKIWTSRAEHSDLMLLLARTTPRDQVAQADRGSVHLHRRHQGGVGKGMTIRPIRTMMNHNYYRDFFDNMEVPAENLVGVEGRGFRYILDGMNAERLLIASERVGDAKWFTEGRGVSQGARAVRPPIGQNQGVQIPSPGPMRKCARGGRGAEGPGEVRGRRSPAARRRT